MDHPLNDLLFENNNIKIQEGYVEKPKTYGLGVKFDEIIIEQFPYKEKINTMISTSDTDIQLI
jgi:L-alanine-DL-glutamate epimerase-like enolase superfamily enzyme